MKTMSRGKMRNVAALTLGLALIGCQGACTSGSQPALSGRAGLATAPEGEESSYALGHGEELWILPRVEYESQALGTCFDVPLYVDEGALDDGEAASDGGLALADVPGCGGLVADRPEGGGRVVVPLEHTDVSCEVRGNVATVEVLQKFRNPYDGKIEAVYVFPLPHDAAVHGFLMVIGERRIRGIVAEREEAERIYRQARAMGHVASLLSQERPNVFTQKVANIEPGAAIDIQIEYFHTLPLVDGWFELHYPMVVGPRFNPPGTRAAGAGIAAVSTDAWRTSGQATEVPYLRPDERSGHDIALSVDLDAGAELEGLACNSHRIEVERGEAGQTLVRLAPDDRLPNKDFVLRYRVAGERTKAAFLSQRDETGGYFTLVLHPPRDLASVTRQAMELVFVIDCSGSMDGEPMELACAAVRRGLDLLRPQDSFQIIPFSERAGKLASSPIQASPRNLRRGHDFVDRLRANGGTMMIHGVRTALSYRPDPERQRLIAFLTDGFIGNEEEILSEIQSAIGDTRIFSFGIGSSPNRFLLSAMAREGRGAAAFVGLSDDPAELMQVCFERISHPALSDIRIDWGALGVTDVFPARVPDLFCGRPVTLVGRMEADPAELPGYEVLVEGSMGRARLHLPVSVCPDGPPAEHRALPWIWARAKIADLTSRARGARGEGELEGIAAQVRDLALAYGLVSAYTSFVAVDSLSQTAGEYGTTVPVAVPVPEGVRYETTVGGG